MEYTSDTSEYQVQSRILKRKAAAQPNAKKLSSWPKERVCEVESFPHASFFPRLPAFWTLSVGGGTPPLASMFIVPKTKRIFLQELAEYLVFTT